MEPREFSSRPPETWLIGGIAITYCSGGSVNSNEQWLCVRTWSPNCKDELGTGYVLSLEHNVGLQGHAAFEKVTNLNGIYFATEMQLLLTDRSEVSHETKHANRGQRLGGHREVCRTPQNLRSLYASILLSHWQATSTRPPRTNGLITRLGRTTSMSQVTSAFLSKADYQLGDDSTQAQAERSIRYLKASRELYTASCLPWVAS